MTHRPERHLAPGTGTPSPEPTGLVPVTGQPGVSNLYPSHRRTTPQVQSAHCIADRSITLAPRGRDFSTGRPAAHETKRGVVAPARPSATMTRRQSPTTYADRTEAAARVNGRAA